MTKNLEDLIQKRKTWIKSSRDNNFDFTSILGGLYEDPSHFIYEILQNAEDAIAKSVNFQLYESRLEISNDGIEFDFDDVDAITGIGISAKKDDLNKIGKFGVGFKSVYAISSSPLIHSGRYHFIVKDFVVPEVMSKQKSTTGAQFIIPFNHDFRLPNEIYDMLADKLQKMGPRSLLFLNNIKRINWATNDDDGYYERISRKVRGFQNVFRVHLKSSKGESERFLVFRKPLRMKGSSLRVEVAYKLENINQNQYRVIPEDESNLYAYFETGKTTYLRFLIQAPFKTTLSRDNIPLGDEDNRILLNTAADLVANSLPVLKKLGYLDANLLSMLPIESRFVDLSDIYSVVYRRIREILLSNKSLLPGLSKKHVRASDALLTKSKSLTKLLTLSDLKELFVAHRWLDLSITQDRFPELRKYLINELEIEEIGPSDFAYKVGEDFLKKKSDSWIISFYKWLLRNKSLWQKTPYGPDDAVLRKKKIIRSEQGDHVEPFNRDGNPKIFLPTAKKSNFRTVKKYIVRDKNALKFLTDLGLTIPDLLAEIVDFIIPKYLEGKVDINNSYYDDISKILDGYNKFEENKRGRLVEQLKTTPFILCHSITSKQKIFRTPNEVYYKDSLLVEFFSDDYSIYFLDDEILSRFPTEEIVSLLDSLGVKKAPLMIEFNTTHTYEEKRKLRKFRHCAYDDQPIDYTFQGLDKFLPVDTVRKSTILFNILNRLLVQNGHRYDEGKYKWHYYYWYTESFDATWVVKLRNSNWLFDADNKLLKPAEFRISDLDESYRTDELSAYSKEWLERKLLFKSEIPEDLPATLREKLALVEDISTEDLEILIERWHLEVGVNDLPIEEHQEDGVDPSWEPEVEANEVEIRISIIEPEKNKSANLERQIEDIEDRTPITSTTEEEREQPVEGDTFRHVSAKDIGRWGEEYVYQALIDRYNNGGTIKDNDHGCVITQGNKSKTEIIWLNKNVESGKGYDFAVKQINMETLFIEVKSKTGEDIEYLQMTGTQWNFARELNENGKGEYHALYIVENAGKRNSRIKVVKDIIQKWKDGKVEARAIDIRV